MQQTHTVVQHFGGNGWELGWEPWAFFPERTVLYVQNPHPEKVALPISW